MQHSGASVQNNKQHLSVSHPLVRLRPETSSDDTCLNSSDSGRCFADTVSPATGLMPTAFPPPYYLGHDLESIMLCSEWDKKNRQLD